MQDITKKTYFAYALQVYDNPSCSGMKEFHDDLLRLKYVRRLVHKYTRTSEVSVRLLVNHIISVYNVFQPSAVARLLFFRLNKDSYSALKTILEYLNLMPDTILPIDGKTILNTDIPRDDMLWEVLIQEVEESHAITR